MAALLSFAALRFSRPLRSGKALRCLANGLNTTAMIISSRNSPKAISRSEYVGRTKARAKNSRLRSMKSNPLLGADLVMFLEPLSKLIGFAEKNCRIGRSLHSEPGLDAGIHFDASLLSTASRTSGSRSLRIFRHDVEQIFTSGIRLDGFFRIRKRANRVVANETSFVGNGLSCVHISQYRVIAVRR